MKSLVFLLALPLPFLPCAFAAEAPPEKALKYHEALLKRPSNDTLFDRFFGAWLDEQDIAALEVFLKARAEQNGGADLSVLARFQLRRGNEDGALETLGKAIAALPGDVSLPMERAKVLLRRLEFEGARKDLEIVAAGADAALALEASKLSGKSWLREGNPEQAIKVWDKLLAANPGDEDLLEDLVESAAAEGETNQALAYVDKLIAAGSDPYKKTLRQLRRADLLAQAGRHDDAVDAYSATLADVGEGSWLEREVLAQIDKAYRKQDRLGDLKNKLAELAEANPRRLIIHRNLAKIEAAEGETDAAVGRFREVLKRSPGDRELREEFVRLLTDGEKFDEAAGELEKLIALAPEDAGLLLQMADLRNRQGNRGETLAALTKAHGMLGTDEAAGIRISGLMLQYGLAAEGEKLLKELAAADGATAAPSEALAAEYARTNRKPEALAILEKIGASDNLESVLRSAGSISALGENAVALKILSAKLDAFGQEPRFLAAISQAALAAGKPDIAVTQSLKLVRMARESAELAESIGLALRSISAADKSAEWRSTLEKQGTRTPAETCLLAALADSQDDFEAVSKIMGAEKDPAVIRFHAALLDRRGEFEKAIAVLAALAESEEGRKTSYFKDMADLQRRAGLTEDAIATVELWKQSAPGDKTAWITGGSILREEGRVEDAVKATRQAVARFGEDADLAATLASLHEEAGQTEDAEAIYWRLYDESANPSDQARWSVRLAQLALATGRTDELGEKLRERARGNRRSIGPILAQAELARVTRNEEQRRDLLLEAVRLQPKDIDLRLQIANLEEQGGNPERVIAILEEALAADPSNRIRSSLAQAYLRQGQTLKGMRELRALAGKQGDDPRSIEQSAATLAGSGLYEDAIRFLRDALPDGGDWRTKYLLAIMLEKDGRETEAIPLFHSLRQATGDLPGAKPMPASPTRQMDGYPEEIGEIVKLMSASQAAYAHSNRNNGGGWYGRSGTMVGPFVLPDSADDVRQLSLIHLARLGAEGIENGDFIRQLSTDNNGGQPDFPALLSKFPEQPGLLEIALLYAAWNEDDSAMDKENLRKILAERKDLDAGTMFRANLVLAKGAEETDPAWEAIVASAAGMAKSQAKDETLQAGYQLLQILSSEDFGIPAKVRKSLSETLLGLVSRKGLEEGPLDGFRLVAINAVGTTEQWIEAANEEIKEFRSESPGGANLRQQSPYSAMGARHFNRFMGGGSPFVLPDLDMMSFVSMPQAFAQMIRPANLDDEYGGSKPVDPEELLKHIDRIESPLLRAWVALRAGDEAAADKALSVEPPAAEAGDFGTLKAMRALAKKDYPAAYRMFSALRPAYSADRGRIDSLNMSLVAIATEMTAEQRVEISDDLNAIFMQLRRTLGPQGGQVLAAQAETLGLADLAKRLQPPASGQPGRITPLGAANIGVQPTPSGGNPTIEKMQKFSAAGKNEAAAMEALNIIRKANLSGSNRSYEVRQVKDSITPEVIAELFKLIDPGDSKSLTKLTEYADICMDFGKNAEALAVLTRLNKERPDDASVSAKLAFLLPADQRELAVRLISTAASGEQFPAIAGEIAGSLSGSGDNSRTFAYFDTIATWLAGAAPADLGKANLSWVGYHAKSYFENDYSGNLPDLGDITPGQAPKAKDFARQVEIAKRLALAMLRHDSIAEEGFRLLGYSKAWKIPEAEMDGHARSVLLSAASLRGHPFAGSGFFEFRTRFGSSSSGEDLDEHSSVQWLVSRLANAKSPDEILPPAYLAQLAAKDRNTGELVSALAHISDVAGLEKLWKSDAMKDASGPFSDMLSKGVLARAAFIPGAGPFFLERIRELKPGWVTNGGENQASVIGLFVAALQSSAAGDAKELDAVCSAISKSVFGDKIDLEAGDDRKGMEVYQAVRMIESIFSYGSLDAVASIRIHRAFFRLGIPAGSNDYSLLQAFQELRIKNAEEGEKLFASFSWLDDADKWEPFAAILAEADRAGFRMTFSREETFLMPEAIQYMDYDSSTSELAKRLENRKPQTFGSLITAACLSEGAERGRLTAKAFTVGGAKLAKLPPERLKSFSLLLPWLPEEATATLPPALRNMAKDGNAEKLAKLMAAADAFLKPAAANNNNPFGNSPLDEAEDLVRQLAPLDPGKGVQVFLEAERRFTAGLTRGGRLSSYSTSGLQITERDEALEDLITDTDAPLGKPAPALAFHNAIASSPEAARFSFSTSSNNTSVLFKIGYRIYVSAAQGSNPKEQQWMRALRQIGDMPGEAQRDAYLALGTFLCGRYAVSVLRGHTTPAELEALPEQARVIHTIAVGVRNWKTDSPAQRAATSAALVSVAGDSGIPFPTRFQLVSMAVTLAAPILDDPAIAETYATMFEQYAKEERSVVNGIGIHSATVIRLVPPTETMKPVLARINKAFWDNANTPKAGGHPPIPPEFTDELFVAAANAGDKPTANKLLGAARASIKGDITVILSLISGGNHELAMDLLADANSYYRTSAGAFTYGRHFESQFEAFRKIPALDPVALLRVEALLMEARIGTAADSPAQSLDQRLARIVAAYRANPPRDIMLRTEILSRLARDSHTAAIAFHDEIISLSKELDLRKALSDWANGVGSATDPAPRFFVATAESVIFRQAAFLLLLDGDPSALNEVVKVLGEQPPLGGSRANGERDYVRSYMARINESAPLWVCEAVHLGKTDGFAKAYGAFETMSLLADKRPEFDAWETTKPVTMAEFFAHWNGEGAKFETLRKKLKRNTNALNYLKDRWGILQFAKIAKQHVMWGRSDFAATRRDFLLKVFTRPEMTAYFGHLQRWLPDAAADGGLRDDLLAIAANPPQGTVPTVLTHLLKFRSDNEFREGRYDSGVASAIAAIDTCPADGPWKDIRFRLRFALLEKMLGAGKTAQAKEYLAGIDTADLSEFQVKRLKEFGAKLEKAGK